MEAKPTVSQPPSCIDALTDDLCYPALKAYIIQTTGLTYYSDKDDDLGRRIRRRFASLGMQDCAGYLEILRNPLRGRAELDQLIAEITIGETYFFRHTEHFTALRDIVLPDLIARNEAKQSLRIWCAGCSDGPEVYSLAILLARELGHKLTGWKVSILGTDVNQTALARAREGKFEEWDLRATSEGLRRECFIEESRYWRIAPRYRQWTSFQYHNLAEDPFPSVAKDIAAFDLIVCRNVLIYFGPVLMDKMIPQFYDSLVDGAWLLVGPTEPNMTSFRSFAVVNAPGVTMYRKMPPDVPVAAPFEFNLPTALSMPRPALRLAPVTKKAAAIRPAAEPTLATVRTHADRGDWANAAGACELLLKKENLNSRVHFYHGLVLEQMGRGVEAALAVKRAIYLDRRNALPHYYLGTLLQSQGDRQQAARCFENAVQLLEECSETDVFSDADGITAAEIKKLAKMHLEVLQA